MRSFLDLGLSEALAQGFVKLGFEAPTSIQALAIPAILERKDLLMESETGTGKTFAYLAPALALVARAERRGSGPICLVAAPTQELAVQIGREAERLITAAGLEITVAVLLGGTPLVKQTAKLKTGPELVVGTLGRLADLIALRKLRTATLGLLVLDEADRILSPETEALGLSLLAAAPASCARVLASATLPDRTRRSAAPYLRKPVYARLESRPVLGGDIEHWCFYCDGRKRVDFLRHFEAAIKPQRCLVFLSNASRIEGVVERLAARGLPIAGIHARLEKEARRRALERFTEGELRYLVTSDLGARGLDVPGISHVLSLDLPEEASVYVHRAGRTGRAGAKGVSVVLVDGVELKRASRIAVREGFVFRTKLLSEGRLFEPSPEEFFALVEEAEESRHRSLAAKKELDGKRAVAEKKPRVTEARRRLRHRGADRPSR